MIKITSKNIIEIKSASSKKEVLEIISKRALEMGITTSDEALVKAFEEREAQSSTGFELGFAIPHARIAEIKSPSIFVVRIKEGIDWPSMDGQLTDIAIGLCVPADASAGENHMYLLSKMSEQLMDGDFQNLLKTGTSKDIVSKINAILNTSAEVMPEAKQEVKEEVKSEASSNQIKVVAITACATGIAHTFMAAKKLEEEAKKHNVSIRVQKNGASGPETPLTQEEIEEADYVILAADVFVDREQFEGKKVVKVPVAYAIKSTTELLTTLESQAEVQGGAAKAKSSEKDNKNKFDNKKSKQKESWIYKNILTHVMSGVSAIIPLLVAAGVLLALGKLLASFTGDLKISDNYAELFKAHGSNFWYKFVYFINISGIVVLWMMFPLFGLFTAQSIGGKNAVLPGFMVGILADGDHLFTRIWRTFGGSDPATNPFIGAKRVLDGDYPFLQFSSGFFGVLVGAILVGYFVKMLNTYIKIGGVMAPLKTILIVPGLAIIFTMLIQVFVINPPFALLNQGITDIAEKSQGAVIAFGVFVAFATAFDMGGPVNKAVGAVAIGLAAQGTVPLTARTIAIVIPPLGLGLATLLAKPIFRKDLYDNDLKIAGRTSLFLGLIAITEGGLPFLFKKPLITIASSTVGAIAGALFATLIGAQMWQPLPAVYGWPLIGQAPSNASVSTSLAVWAQILVYILAVVLGTLITSFTDIGLRLAELKREKNIIAKKAADPSFLTYKEKMALRAKKAVKR